MGKIAQPNYLLVSNDGINKIVYNSSPELALKQISGYRPFDLKECVQGLHDLQLNRRAGALLKCVVEFSSPSEIPDSFFLRCQRIIVIEVINGREDNNGRDAFDT
ncbi:Cyclin A/B/D/E [Artemisia annua]|uniref:Cyclin A/B/D/E n=1 Tax=Artemisia annua TaxID=35608 RepID=A0A2U1KV08_ARTAN|nr:Cyclin A/B/D/E [Artemisia annua]